MVTIFPHDSGLARVSYLIDRGRFSEIPRLHILEHEKADLTLCGITVGDHWIWGEDPEFEPTPEAYQNFIRPEGLGCKRCARALWKRVQVAQAAKGLQLTPPLEVPAISAKAKDIA